MITIAQVLPGAPLPHYCAPCPHYQVPSLTPLNSTIWSLMAFYTSTPGAVETTNEDRKAICTGSPGKLVTLFVLILTFYRLGTEKCYDIHCKTGISRMKVSIKTLLRSEWNHGYIISNIKK